MGGSGRREGRREKMGRKKTEGQTKAGTGGRLSHLDTTEGIINQVLSLSRIPLDRFKFQFQKPESPLWRGVFCGAAPSKRMGTASRRSASITNA